MKVGKKLSSKNVNKSFITEFIVTKAFATNSHLE